MLHIFYDYSDPELMTPLPTPACLVVKKFTQTSCSSDACTVQKKRFFTSLEQTHLKFAEYASLPHRLVFKMSNSKKKKVDQQIYLYFATSHPNTS